MKKYRVLAHLMAHNSSDSGDIASDLGLPESEVKSYLVALHADDLIATSARGFCPVRGRDDSL